MTCWISAKDGSTIHSKETFKLLGFLFSDKPNVHAQVDYIVNRAASRSFVLRHLASFNADKKKMTNIYCSLVRSILEYSCVTFGPMLTKFDSNRLEAVQKKALRCIFGYGLEYDELLSLSGLETLEERRRRALLKFAQKASKNPQFSDWFPLNQNRGSLRNPREFEEKYAKSDRLYNSPLYTMRRYLNGTPERNRNYDLNIQDLSYLFNAA